jgi:hypothetical protein
MSRTSSEHLFTRISKVWPRIPVIEYGSKLVEGVL